MLPAKEARYGGDGQAGSPCAVPRGSSTACYIVACSATAQCAVVDTALDFPGGSARTRYRSSRRILDLPPETSICVLHDCAPGRRQHAWEPTIGARREANKHMRDAGTAFTLDRIPYPRRSLAGAGRQWHRLPQAAKEPDVK